MGKFDWGRAALFGPIGGATGWLEGGDDEEMQVPEFEEDPLFREKLDYIDEFTKGILEGDLPEYYKPIGEFGGEEFENMLGMTNRDIQRGVTEDAARRGSRGGAASTAIARATGDASTQARYADYTRAIENRKSLLGTGLQGQQYVAGGAFDFMGLKNQYNLNKFGIESNLQAQEDAAQGDFLGSLLSAGVTAAGLFTGNPMLAASGASGFLGSMQSQPSASSPVTGQAIYQGQNFNTRSSPLLADFGI